MDGNVTEIQVPDGSGTDTYTYGYDLLGRLTTWTDGAGGTSTATYNSLGWKMSLSDMDTGTSTYQYDNGGLLTGQTDAKRQTTTSAYDALGRITGTTYPDGSTAAWSYDEGGHDAAIGRLTSVTYPAGSESHTWDARGKETATTQCVGTVCQTMNSAYDGMGRLSGLTYPDGEHVAYTYGADGQLATVGNYVTAMAWSPAGLLTKLTDGNGTTTTYRYDPNRQWLTGANTTGPGNTNLYQASYAYNAAGLVTGATQGAPSPVTDNYTYDTQNRLTAVSGAQQQTFGYDAAGDMTANSAVGTYAYTDPAHKHAVTTTGNTTYTYDADGNMLTGAGRTLTWDGANRLSSTAQNGTTTDYSYDAGQRRLEQTDGTNVTRYFSQYTEQVNGTLVKYYYAGPVRVARSSGGDTTWYTQDRIDSTRLLTDATGTDVRTYDYQPYGGVQSTTGTAPNDRTFTGQVADDGTGLLYMNARYQDPTLGRFISPDSTIPNPTNPADINRYSYANDNPVNLTDPTGHRICFPDEMDCEPLGIGGGAPPPSDGGGSGDGGSGDGSSIGQLFGGDGSGGSDAGAGGGISVHFGDIAAATKDVTKLWCTDLACGIEATEHILGFTEESTDPLLELAKYLSEKRNEGMRALIQQLQRSPKPNKVMATAFLRDVVGIDVSDDAMTTLLTGAKAISETPIVQVGKKALPILGPSVGFAQETAGGDGPATAVVKVGIEMAFSDAGELAGQALADPVAGAVALIPGVDVSAPVILAGGGLAGAAVGNWYGTKVADENTAAIEQFTAPVDDWLNGLFPH